jgi:hypothetical protein
MPSIDNVFPRVYPKGTILILETQENLGSDKGTVFIKRKVRTKYDWNPKDQKPLEFEIIPDN